MQNINPKVVTYYKHFRKWIIKPKDIEEEKIFSKRNWIYMKTMNNKLTYRLY